MQRTTSTAKIPEQARASTGIAGLDVILGGGLPAQHVYLIEGDPGSGKTTLGLQFLRQGVKENERGLYVTLSETAAELRTVASSHGWTLDGIELFELVSSEGLSPELEQSILHPSQVELGETVRGVISAVERLRPQRVVFDSLSEMRLLAQDPLRYRRQVLALKKFFADQGCTVLLLDDRSSRDTDQQLHSIAHGVISLEQAVDQYGPERRRLRVFKMRGIKFRGGEHDFVLDTGGLSVFPRLVAAEHRITADHKIVSSGVTMLDALMGGGLPCGSNTLFSGPSGVGKTTTAMACALAALKRGSRAVYYLFDEGLATLLIRGKALGMDLEPYLVSGQLRVVPLDPAEVSAGEFAHMVRHAVEDDGAGLVVIDSLNAYLQAMPGSKYLMLQMHELLTYLNHRNIVTILILGQHGVLGEIESDVDMSYLADAILLFRYFEARGRLLKAVSMVKSRTNRHEQTIREFRMGPGGLEVGQELTDFEGVIAGVTAYRGDLPLLGDRQAGRT
ncbi:AAA family ATPase [Ramlibacter ginsenosidimutans]|uniref:non-specific serine/threonine protein kinase n=1 Tax=Ramlibacter ginsenosidimutans TaxID=502333 RepID=A0A934U081_9BURK|nr:ATPase domain-containing protein [Ramlibacter ginsenosidimutans]MBK6008887.1 AAA family ATPase [Ramlibacter ginsenosidimutans]